MVELGGRRASATEEIARLDRPAARRPAEVAAPTSEPADFELPSEVEPLWSFRFQSKVDPNNPTQPFPLTDVYGRNRPNDFVIPAAADDQRAYVNLFGVEMAFDLATGKLLWRSGKLHLLQLQQQRQGIMPERYSIAVAKGRTWSVLRDPQQANQGVGFALVVREAATGKEIFSTRRSLSAWNILGEPYLSDYVPPGTAPATETAAPPATVADTTPTGPPLLNYADGFAGAADSMAFNGGVAKIEGTKLQLTDGGAWQASSAFVTKPVDVRAFYTRFRMHLLPDTSSADGMTFTIQGVGPAALGSNGQGLGYQGIERSVAVKFDLYDRERQHANATGMFMLGVPPKTAGAIPLGGTGIDLHSGHPFDVTMAYDDNSLKVTITDTETKASNTQTYAVNIPDAVGGNTAYLGFTASSGLVTSKQSILNWTYWPITPHKTAPPVGGTVYVGASRTGQGRELALLMLNAKDGKLIKNVTIGNHAVDQNQVYGDRISQPSLLVYNDRLYVDTHAGALVSMQAQSGSLDWGVLYDSPPPMTGYYYNYEPPPLGISGPIRAAGLDLLQGNALQPAVGHSARGAHLHLEAAGVQDLRDSGGRRRAAVHGRRGADGLQSEDAGIAVGRPVAARRGLELAAGYEEPALSIHLARCLRSRQANRRSFEDLPRRRSRLVRRCAAGDPRGADNRFEPGHHRLSAHPADPAGRGQLTHSHLPPLIRWVFAMKTLPKFRKSGLAAIAAATLACWLPLAPAVAQVQVWPNNAAGEGIAVYGTGELTARPNMVEIDLHVSGKAELTGDALVKYRDAKKRLLEALDKLKLPGLSTDELVTDDRRRHVRSTSSSE